MALFDAIDPRQSEYIYIYIYIYITHQESKVRNEYDGR